MSTIDTGMPFQASFLQNTGVTPGTPSGHSSSVAAFGEAMRNAGVTPAGASFQPVQGVQVAQLTTPVGPVTDVPLPEQVRPAATVDPADSARQRAVEGLELSQTPVAEVGPGQSILDGLQRIRGIFDGQIGNLNSRIESAQFDAADLMTVQAEVVTFSVMVDVSSKLAGKSTQAMDTLMKGQ